MQYIHSISVMKTNQRKIIAARSDIHEKSVRYGQNAKFLQVTSLVHKS